MDSASSASNVGPATAVEVSINDPFVTLFTPEGDEVKVHESAVAVLTARMGLQERKHDLDAAEAEWHAAYVACEDAVLRGIEEMRAVGYQRDETVWVMNEAMGRMVNAYRVLTQALGALVPTEAHVASLSGHAALHGLSSLTNLPGQNKHAPVVEAYMAANPAAAPDGAEGNV